MWHPIIDTPSVTGYDGYAGYRIKIKIICRLTKDKDPALILISSQLWTNLIIQ